MVAIMEVMDATPCITSFAKRFEGDSNRKDSFREDLTTDGLIIALAGCLVVLWVTL